MGKGNGQVYVCAEDVLADRKGQLLVHWVYHHTTESCPALRSRNTRRMDKDEAERLGWKPCKHCHM